MIYRAIIYTSAKRRVAEVGFLTPAERETFIARFGEMAVACRDADTSGFTLVDVPKVWRFRELGKVYDYFGKLCVPIQMAGDLKKLQRYFGVRENGPQA